MGKDTNRANLVEPLEPRQLFAAAAYRILDLGTLGGTFSQGNGINARGHVAMESFDSEGLTHAARYGMGKLTDFGTFSFAFDARATAINDSDTIAGYGTLDNGVTEHAFVGVRGKLHDLGSLQGGDASSHAYGINNAGQIVGDSWLRDPVDGVTAHAVLFQNGKIHDLGTLGGPSSEAKAINNNGQVVGGADPPSISPGEFPVHAFIYSRGVMKDLGTLPGRENSEAFAINSRGWVAGTSRNFDGPTRAFLYKNGKMIDLGTLAGGQSSASAVNDDGIVVGDSVDANDDYHAFIYRNGKMRDLNTLIDPRSGWTLEGAMGINNLGKITGVGEIHGLYHAFLMVPARIEGMVYRDSNSNGLRDENEQGVAGARVYLDIFGDGAYHAGDPTTFTDADGRFSFGSLAAGKYRVGVVPPKGFLTTVPQSGVQSVTLEVGELRTKVRFGVR